LIGPNARFMTIGGDTPPWAKLGAQPAAFAICCDLTRPTIMGRARTCPWIRTRPYRVLLRGQGVFFAAQSSADCITNMFGFDLRQAQAFIRRSEQNCTCGIVQVGPYSGHGLRSANADPRRVRLPSYSRQHARCKLPSGSDPRRT